MKIFITYIFKFFYSIKLLRFFHESRLIQKQEYKQIKTFLKFNHKCNNRIKITENLLEYNSPQFIKDALNYYVERIEKSNSPKILIISHELSRTGAPFTLLNLVKVVRQNFNISPYILSLKDGPLRYEFEKDNCIVLPNCFEQLDDNDFVTLLNKFDVIWVNSLCTSRFSAISNSTKYTIWWTHDAYWPIEYQHISRFVSKVKKVLVVSPLNKENLDKICNRNVQCTLFPYGLKEETFPLKEKKDYYDLEIGVFGSISKTKGSDTLISYINSISPELSKRIHFTFVGGVSNELQKLVSNCKGATFIKTVPFDELLQFYSNVDAVFIPSIYDSMPIVASHAFMAKKVCICSNRTGTSRLISNYIDGIVVDAYDTNTWTETFNFLLNNKDKMKEIGNSGYNIYEKYFSLKSFEKNVVQVLNDAGIK